MRSRKGAGIAEEPGIAIPSASDIAFIVEAVPMVLQWPSDGAEAQARSMNSSGDRTGNRFGTVWFCRRVTARRGATLPD